MTIQKDGQARCDKCGKIDGDKTSNKLVEGWTRKISPDRRDKHYCPNCKNGM